MAWLRFDDDYPQHPKVMGLCTAAAWLNTCAICYAGRHHTDGFLPAAVVPRLWHFERGIRVPKLIAELLAARLWDAAEGGYLVHDFLDYNQSREQVDATHQKKSFGGRARAAKATTRVGGRFSTEGTSEGTSTQPAGTLVAAGEPPPAHDQLHPLLQPRKDPPLLASLVDPPPAARQAAKVSRTRSRRLPPTETLTVLRQREAMAEGLAAARLDREWAKFRDHEFATPHTDWDATWRNWARRASENWTPREREAEPVDPEREARLQAMNAIIVPRKERP